MDIDFLRKIDFQSLLANPKKSNRRQIQVAEAAIELLHKDGLANFSYDLLAKKCEISRGVIYNYFPTLDNLLMFTCGMIRFQYQTLVITEVAKQKTPIKMLQSYILTALKWIDVYPKHATVWLLFFHQCAHATDFAQFNKELVDQGTQRIAAIMMGALKLGEISLNPEQIPHIARIIQTLVTGCLMARATEYRTQDEWKAEFELILKTAFSLMQSQSEPEI